MHAPVSASVPTAVRRLPPTHTHTQPQQHAHSPAAGHSHLLRATQSALIAAAAVPTASSTPLDSVHLSVPALRHKNLSRFLHTELGGSIFLNRLRTGGIFLKHGARGTPHFRFVCCTHDLTRVEWMDLKGKKNQSAPHSAQAGAATAAPSQSFVLSDSILAVSLGHSTRLLRDRAAVSKDSLSERCFSLCTTTRTLDLECLSEQERDLWHLTFSFLMDYTQKRRTAEIKQQQQQHSKQQTAISTPQLTSRALPSGSSSSDGFPGLDSLRPAAPPADGPQSHLSLVHALELLCDQSIGQAQARHAQQAAQQQQQPQQEEQQQPPDQPALHQPGLEIPPAAVCDLRSSIQSPLHPTLSHLHSEAKSTADAAAPDLADSKHALDGPPEKTLNTQHVSAEPSSVCTVAPTPVTRPSPPSAVPVSVPAPAPVPAPASAVRACVPLPLPPLDPDLVRLNLLRDLDASRESNRRLYIDSAAQMIDMQEQIDAITRENVALIRAIAPTTSAHAHRW